MDILLVSAILTISFISISLGHRLKFAFLLIKTIALSIILISSGYTLANASSSIKQKPCQLAYGLTQWEPLQYVNKQGEYVGIQIDLINAIAEKLNCRLIFMVDKWNNNLRKIESGVVDFTANATQSSERERYAIFSNPYRRDSFTIIVKSKNLFKYTSNSIEDLKQQGFVLGLTQQYLYGDKIESWIKDTRYSKNLNFSQSTEDNIEKLLNDEIDGFIEDPFVISFKQRRKEFPEKLTSLPMKIFGLEASFIFSKKNFDQAFVDRFNNALREVQKSPKYQTIWIDPIKED